MDSDTYRYVRKDAQPKSRTTPGLSATMRSGVMLLLLAGCTPDEPQVYPHDRLTVEYSIDRESIRVGDPVELIVTAYYPTNGVLELPEIGREKAIVLLKRDWTELPRDDGLTQSESRYAITSFRLGDQVISTNSILCRVDGVPLYTTNFPRIVLSVESALADADAAEIADIKPMHKLPARVPPWLWISLGTALAAFAIGLLASRYWKHRPLEPAAPPPIPPHIIAFKALEALHRKGLLDNDECKPFYTELSLILRTYLEGRFRLNAPDETTEEIVEEMSRSSELSGVQRNILQDFMRQADIVKFAKGHPDRPTMESAYETTKHFVEETKQDPSNSTHPHSI